MVNQVHKFGGSSLSSVACFKRVANIILTHTHAGDCVVVSAAGKTTDTLVKLWQSYKQQDSQAIADIVLPLSNHQTDLIEQLLAGSPKRDALEKLAYELNIITTHAKQGVLAETALLAHGELWSARLLSAYLNQLNTNACAHDARELFILEAGQLQHTNNQQQCLSAIQSNKINVVTGFIAADLQGNTVTLGRNGSDYSAALLARYCNAKKVSIWTDTQGVFSTDPRKVVNAIKYARVCREQANLLARLGNPVLHAKTLSPLKDTDIELTVRSSYDPQGSHTDIVKQGMSKQKRFLTTIHNVDLLTVEALSEGEVTQVSQLIQHSLHHFQQGADTYLIVPASATHQVVNYFAGRANICESNLNGVAVIASAQDTAQLNTHSNAILSAQSITPRFTHHGDGYTLLLTDQLIDTDVLSLLHDKLINKAQEVALIVAGLGNVGAEFMRQLPAQLARLSTHFNLKLVALLRSEQMLVNTDGLGCDNWQQQWQHHAIPYQQSDLITYIDTLEYEHKVVIDITASEYFSQLYSELVELNCHLISANKYAGTAPLSWYQSLREHIAQRGLHWRYNASVGAGLPINFALADLQNSGDKITRIEGVFSGTLSWLCSMYDGSKAFSDLVLEAQALGFTEPDPREDLSGRDMQRKLLILARELGIELELDDITLSALMPDELSDGNWNDFLENKDVLDTFIAKHAQAAQQQNAKLCYTGLLEFEDNRLKAKVGIAYVPKDKAVANLTPGDNIFVINTQWYNQNALVIQGPGAGKEVTAAGVHSDLYWLIQNIS